MKNCESNQAGMRQGENYFFKKNLSEKEFVTPATWPFLFLDKKQRSTIFFFSEEGINIKRQSQRKNEYIG